MLLLTNNNASYYSLQNYQNFIMNAMHSRTLNDQEQEFRNKGAHAISNKIIKGVINEAPVKLQVSSIPSKYQNTITKNYSRQAFGDSTRKFFHLTNDSVLNPGPGNYEVNKKFSQISSKKGTGFFASKTKLHRLQRTISHGPGPNTYRSDSIRQKKSLKKKKMESSFSSINKSQSTSILSTRNKFRSLFENEIINSNNIPSVGTYELNPQRVIKIKSSYSTFKSKIQRFTESKQSQIPPVGYYDLTKGERHVKYATKKMQVPKEQSQNHKQFRLKKAFKNIEQRQMKQKIGPGSYQTLFPKTAKSFKIRQTIYDRFGNLKPVYKMLQNKVDDAQEQNHMKTELRTLLSPSKTYGSIFKSKTTRSDIKLRNQMDPGIYNVKNQPIKKSHLINFMQKWV